MTETPRDTSSTFDLDAFALNIGRVVEESGKAMAAWLRPREDGRIKGELAEETTEAVKTLGHLAEYWLKDPQRAIEAQASLAQGFMDLWASSLKRASGEDAPPAAVPDPRDPRFKDPEWSKNQYYDFLKQAYLITSRWAKHLVDEADGLDPHLKHKADFYVRQITAAISPSNFIPTNPELVRETLAESGENLVRGAHNLARDIEEGQGELKVRQSDGSAFQVGVNLATTAGKVVYRNDLIELLQYAPSTKTVLKRPLLIVPPWINKFYVLDLNAEKSFIKWCVDQGLTVFTISWVNPDDRHRHKGFDDYIQEGPLAALTEIERITGETEVSAIGYCVGGTLLAITLGLMAARGDRRIASATFFTTQVDFENAGDLKIFVDENQIETVEQKMQEHGYLPGRKMAAAFNMMRSQELIWPYIVNNYLKGQEPKPFDLLFWNADSTRMPAANHSFYLRGCYLENRLARGAMEVLGTHIDLGKVTIPIFNLATREDHIAPALSVFKGSSAFGGPVQFVLAGSGHISGVVNPPSRGKYQYWTGGPPLGDFTDWLNHASEHPGSWWPHWFAWIVAQASATLPASRRKPGGKHRTLGDAPGTYVKMKD